MSITELETGHWNYNPVKIDQILFQEFDSEICEKMVLESTEVTEERPKSRASLRVLVNCHAIVVLLI